MKIHEHIRFVKDGKIQGWVFMAAFLIFDLVFAALGFLNVMPDKDGVGQVRKGWEGPMGDKIINLTIWLSAIFYASKRIQDLLPTIVEKFKSVGKGKLDDEFNGKAG